MMNGSKTNVSIIIATYNSGKTLNVALDSVLKQSYQEWECIVVDGASKDSTMDIVKMYADKDSRFRYISEPDKGIYDAFNKGWRMARGEWIHYLGSDDKLTVNGIADLIENSDSGDLLIGNTYLVKPWGEITEQISKGRRGCHQSMLTRRVVIEALGGFDERYRIVADADLTIRLEKGGYVIKNINSFVSFFSLQGMSQSVRNNYRMVCELYQIYKCNNYYRYPFYICLRMFLMKLFIGIYRYIKNIFVKSNH